VAIKLSVKQRAFTKAIGELITWANDHGYELTFDDAYAKTGHIDGSFHYKRLAIDLNLFINGVYQKSTAAHVPIGVHWESMGGTWGGRFRKRDGNHYSWGETRG